MTHPNVNASVRQQGLCVSRGGTDDQGNRREGVVGDGAAAGAARQAAGRVAQHHHDGRGGPRWTRLRSSPQATSLMWCSPFSITLDIYRHILPGLGKDAATRPEAIPGADRAMAGTRSLSGYAQGRGNGKPRPRGPGRFTSYSNEMRRCPRRVSNPQPLGPKPSTLSIELRGPAIHKSLRYEGRRHRIAPSEPGIVA